MGALSPRKNNRAQGRLNASSPWSSPMTSLSSSSSSSSSMITTTTNNLWSCALRVLLVWSAIVVGSYRAFLEVFDPAASASASASASAAASASASAAAAAAAAAGGGNVPFGSGGGSEGGGGVVQNGDDETPHGVAAVAAEAQRESDSVRRMRRREQNTGDTEDTSRSVKQPPPATSPASSSLRYGPLPPSWSSASDPRPLWISVATYPRSDLLGAYVVPSLYLLAIARRHGWAVDVLPYAGSDSQQALRDLFALGHDIDKGWGSGFIDATSRVNYDPAHLNEVAHDALGILPDQPDPYHPNITTEWVETTNGLPSPNTKELDDLCRRNAAIGNGYVRCNLLVPITSDVSDVDRLVWHIMENGGPGEFFTPDLRLWMRRRFLAKNKHRVTHFDDGTYNVAVHVRRGDILDPNRWIEQDVYAAVVRRICRLRKSKKGKDVRGEEGVIKPDKPTAVHIFSSGKNRDGNWAALEAVAETCGGIENKSGGGSGGDKKGKDGTGVKTVSFHLDEYEFDTWAHLVSADALVLSRSAFSYVPALMNEGEVHFPFGFSHLRLPHWRRFRPENGEDVPI